MMLLAVIAGCSESTNAETGSNGSTSVDASGTATADANDGTDAMQADTARSTTDSAPPTGPVDASLEVLTQGVTHVVLSWTEAGDESGIAAYLILKDGEQIAQVDRSTTVFKVEGLTKKRHMAFE